MKMISTGNRLKWILQKLSVTPYKFAKDLGYSRADTVYKIINDEINLSSRFIDEVLNSNYDININWLKHGHGNPFNDKNKTSNYKEGVTINSNIIYPASLSYFYIREIAHAIIKVLFENPESKSLIVEARPGVIEGLEYKITDFSITGNQKELHNYHLILLDPAWRISIYFDSWQKEEEIRYKNKLNFDKDVDIEYSTKFEKVLLPIMNKIEKDETLLENEKFFNEGDNFKELYRTDSRLL